MTFDVTDSDLSSSADPPDQRGSTICSSFHISCSSQILVFPATLTCSSLSLTQALAESLQQISGQLNTVLSALGSLAQRQSATPYTAFPQPHADPAPTTSTPAPALPQLHALGSSSIIPPPSVRLSEPLWNWTPQGSSTGAPLFSTPISSGLRASEDLIHSRWSQIFPSSAQFLQCFVSDAIVAVGPELSFCSAGAAMDPISSGSMRPASNYTSYMPQR